MNYTTRPRFLPLAVVGALVLAAGVSVAGSSAGSAVDWRVVASSGPVEMLPPDVPVDSDSWVPTRRGDVVPSRAVVRTGKRGRTTLARADAVIVVAPRSQIELPSEAPSAESIASVVQTEGSVYYEIERRETPHFEVVTPYLVAGVKGTSFLVSVDEDGATVGVEEGLVEVVDSKSDEALDVAAGEFVGVGDDGLERLDDDDRDDRKERRREERTMASLRNAGGDDDSSDDDGGDSDSDDRSVDVADGDGDGRDDDESMDDFSDDLIADDRDEDSMDDDVRDDRSMDDDVYTDDRDASRTDDDATGTDPGDDGPGGRDRPQDPPTQDGPTS